MAGGLSDHVSAIKELIEKGGSMREAITLAFGVAIATIGVAVFLYAHQFGRASYLQEYPQSHRDLHELLWAAFGIAIWLGGVIITAIGLASWCNNRRG
jgi:hypothetical protein